MSETHNSHDRSCANPPPDLPPLRIHHLMVWMAATAVLISSCMWFDRVARNGPPIFDPIERMALIALAVGIAGALCSVGWGFYWQSQGCAFPSDPGQWLLLEVAAIVCGLLVWLGGSFVFLWFEEDLIEAFQTIWGILLGVSMIALTIYIGLKCCDTRAWRIAVLSIISIPIIVPFALAWAIGNDRRRRIRRHWTHWLGISVLVIWMLSCTALVVRDEYF